MATPQLTLTPDQAFFILLKAREFDAQVEETDPDSGSNPTDDREVDVLEDETPDAAPEELEGAIAMLNDDAQLDLIALIWIGRGDFSLSEWRDARQAAADIGRDRLPRYLEGIPLVSDYLDEALSQLGWSYEDYMEMAADGTGRVFDTSGAEEVDR
jgi:hypothetical protein